MAARSDADRLIRAVLRRGATSARMVLEGSHDLLVPSLSRPRPGMQLPLPFPCLPPADQLPALAALSANALDHRFWVLGRGWTTVRYGERCPGFEGIAYPPAVAVKPDAGGEWLKGQVTRMNLPRCRSVWTAISPTYEPVDWQLDSRSGYRWSPVQRSRSIEVGTPNGTDVKVPWELGRLQHLPVLALACLAAQTGANGFAPAERYAREIADELSDFIATNPPRFGVQWMSTMDVAIRAVNIIVACGLLAAGTCSLPDNVLAVVAGSLRDHALHITHHLEWSRGFRGNHYLSDLVGLVFVGRFLPESSETDRWLTFGIDELLAATSEQILEDGGGIEASTSYQRLVAELVVYGTAAAAGVPADRRARLRRTGRSLWSWTPGIPGVTAPQRSGQPGVWTTDGVLGCRSHVTSIAAAVDFAVGTAHPDGRAPQIGDNDSGRLLKLDLPWQALPPAATGWLGISPAVGSDVFWFEDGLDHRHLLSAASGLIPSLGGDDLSADRRLVVALAGGSAAAPLLRSSWPAVDWGDGRDIWDRCLAAGDHVLRRVIVKAPVGLDLRATAVRSFRHFGLYVFTGPELYLAVRCGTHGTRPPGPHAHQDQLSFELDIGREVVAADPGSYVYTASTRIRDMYRSVKAHNGPFVEDAEVGGVGPDMFVSPATAKARCLYTGYDGFVGELTVGTRKYLRSIVIGRDIVIADLLPPDAPGAGRPGEVAVAAHTGAWPRAVSYSPGYGLRLEAGSEAEWWAAVTASSRARE